jgi:hypothetical protein
MVRVWRGWKDVGTRWARTKTRTKTVDEDEDESQDQDQSEPRSANKLQHPTPTTTPHHNHLSSPLLPIPRFRQKPKPQNKTHLRQKANLNTQCPTSSLLLSSSNLTFLAVLLDRGACCLTVADKSSRYCCGGRERSRSAWIWVRTIEVGEFLSFR